ncbi:16S rRNA (cytidine(1402)-2'-O)-methyltransferase [sulfur-oxidizing endosymbiont of Gigantopelta aegis]|uniref:16S rRNA (cytidine(1402)-2'-O)-methyltransferase n=1 Tax=sulfur-oxidizing endosymbiont of Gigantopelta aegis TaxID=2794934 RepID=UPI003CCE15C1
MKSHSICGSNKTPGQLYIVATPIGNLQDISPRAVDVLKQVDRIAAEDTRHSGHLLKQLDINTHCIALHEHNERQFAEKIVQQIKEGSNIALISDAGTPLVSDPGYFLVKLAHQEKIKVSPIPGPSALIAALSAAGVATDRFCFEGFVPSKGGPRSAFYAQRQKETRTMVFYETPHRIVASLTALCEQLGGERTLVLARELTKTFETIRNDSAQAILDWVKEDSNQQKGEIVLVVQGYAAPEGDTLSEQTEHTLKALLKELSLKQAVKLTVEITGKKKKKIYNYALQLKDQ